MSVPSSWIFANLRSFCHSLLLFAALAVVLSSPARAEQATTGRAFSLRFENDSFGETDENYTNGISMALTTGDEGLFGWVWDLSGAAAGNKSATYELSQLQFTPSDLSLSNPDPQDRPYAGVLYAGLASHLQRKDSLHSLKLLFGVAGPASYSEGVQKYTHGILDYKLPNGWDYQIKNEPILNLLYEYRHRYTLTPAAAPIGVQLIPQGGLFLGNFLTQAGVALQGRFGYHLPADFGTTVLRGIAYLPPPDQERQPHRWGVYAFAGASANLVAWNLTLDGNTLAESRRVRKRLFLPTAEMGMALWTRSFQTTFSYVLMGREFNAQPQREDYGSVLVSFFF